MASVVIHNKLPQSLTLSVLDAQGAAVELRLDPNTASEPLDESLLTSHVRQMAANGHVRIRAV